MATPAFVNVETAASFLGVSKSSCYRAIDAGEFPVPVVKVGSRIKIPTAALYALAGPERASATCAAERSSPAEPVVGLERGDFSKDAA